MAKFPTYEEMSKKVAEKALDEFLYNGKSIREWMQIITSEDAVSRQAVEEMIKAEMPERGMWEIEGNKEKETVCEVCVDLMQKLSELPPGTLFSKGHWIPVSERLPEENGQYLVTVKNLTGYEQLYNNVFECEFFEKDWIFKGWKDNKVIAWMPLPEPYKAESEEKPEKPWELKYVGYSSHDDESHYQCPICKEGYGGWDFVNGSVRVTNGLFRCKCGKLLKKPE